MQGLGNTFSSGGPAFWLFGGGKGFMAFRRLKGISEEKLGEKELTRKVPQMRSSPLSLRATPVQSPATTATALNF